MIEVCLALGSNLANRTSNLNRAVRQIEKFAKITSRSIIIENFAVDINNKRDELLNNYYNMVIWLEVDDNRYSADDFLLITQQIEKEIGRSTKNDYNSRVIDIDIIFFGNLVIDNDHLCIPHKKYQDRSFVVIPLATTKPYWICPRNKQNLLQISSKFIPYESNYIQALPHSIKMMGITNITPDSFGNEKNNNFLSDEFIEEKINEINNNINNGASVIDIGAESTRPDATAVGYEEELRRLDYFFKKLFSNKQFIKNRSGIHISLDSYKSKTVEYIINEYDIDIINNVDYKKTEIFELANKYNKEIVLMHSLSIPSDKNQIIANNIADYQYIIDFFYQQLAKINQIGLSLNKVILDFGIGFGNNAIQAINILRNVDKIRCNFDNEMMLAVSRKSFLNIVTKEDFHNRDIETIGSSLAIVDNFDYIRVHNIEATKRAIVSKQLVGICSH